jgi:hypothetical protein
MTMNFDPFLEAVKQYMQPERRAKHLDGTLPQLLAQVPADVRHSDLIAGWQLLARPHRKPEVASVAHSCEVCAELYTIAARETSEPLAGAVKTWQVWQDACHGSLDPRQAAMAKTVACELVELQSAQ